MTSLSMERLKADIIIVLKYFKGSHIEVRTDVSCIALGGWMCDQQEDIGSGDRYLSLYKERLYIYTGLHGYIILLPENYICPKLY